MKASIIIEGGKVQNIGHRYFLTEAALSFGIEKFRALNTEDGRQVIAFVEGEKEVIEEFYNWVKSSYPANAVVDSVRIEDYVGYVPKIETFALVFNIGLSMKFIESAKEVESAIKEESEKTRDELTSVIKEESKKTREVIVEESHKTREKLGDTFERGFSGLKDEHVKTRELSKEIFYSEVQELRREIRELRDAIEEIKKKVGIA